MKIAIDLGGTNMRVGLTDGATVVDTVIEPCPAQEPEEVVLAQLKRQISQLMRPEVTGIGVGIIIGGGIANAFALYEAPMRQQLSTFPYPENVAATRIQPSTLPNAAMLGASLLH
jgi:predicted NBD/HSP70 family sugar kinase